MRLNLDDKFFNDPRLDALSQKTTKEIAVGSVILLWRCGISYWKNQKKLIPKNIFKFIPNSENLVDFGFAVEKPDGFYCCGATEYWDYYFSSIERLKAAGVASSVARREKFGSANPRSNKNTVGTSVGTSVGTELAKNVNNVNSSYSSSYSSSSSSSSSSSPSSSPKKEENKLINICGEEVGKMPKVKKEKLSSESSSLGLNRAIWEKYSEGYKKNYHVEPIRNAKTNSLIKQFGERLGEIAPEVITFYLTNRDAVYIKCLHSLNMAVLHAESLATQWKAGVRINWSSAKKIDTDQSNRDVMMRWVGKTKEGENL